jgi:hypothetical protein
VALRTGELSCYFGPDAARGSGDQEDRGHDPAGAMALVRS